MSDVEKPTLEALTGPFLSAAAAKSFARDRRYMPHQ